MQAIEKENFCPDDLECAASLNNRGALLFDQVRKHSSVMLLFGEEVLKRERDCVRAVAEGLRNRTAVLAISLHRIMLSRFARLSAVLAAHRSLSCVPLSRATTSAWINLRYADIPPLPG